MICLSFSCSSNSEGYKAGLEFCSCLKKMHHLGRDSARNHCYRKVDSKYELMRRYVNSRDSLILDEKLQDTLNSFVTDFSRAVDSCNPPNWFIEDSLYRLSAQVLARDSCELVVK